jgi:hypothetical protein
MTKGVTMTVFSERMVAETVQTLWAALQRGEFITDAAQLAGTYRKKGTRWLTTASGVRPRRAAISRVAVCPSLSVRRSLWGGSR